jgi:hypothetical protein
MEFNCLKYSVEIVEFLNVETLKEIDCGILDLSKIKNYELREVLLFFEELLTLELKVNYMENDTGIFRVQIIENKYYYKEFGHVIEADSICELKELVLSENRIWYVFDDILAKKLL